LRQYLAGQALQVAQIAQVRLPAPVERQVGRESRGVLMSIEQLIGDQGQLLRHFHLPFCVQHFEMPH